jgi:hypothetical protein
MLVYLAEQLAKNTGPHPDDAGLARCGFACTGLAHGRDASAPLMDAQNPCL